MKNSKGETLPQPYLDLARMRREQQGFSYFRNDYEKTGDMAYAFNWSVSPENGIWWGCVYECESPDIPAASLAELEKWRKAKQREIGMEVHIRPMTADEPATDWKAKYEELKANDDALKVYYKELEAMHERLIRDCKSIDTPTPTRNWVAECAMAVAAALCHAAYMENNEDIVKSSWDIAEEMAAEGRKRGHIN